MVGLAVGLGALAGLAAPASAHATLESTDPANGTALAASPGRIVLHFDEQVSVSPTSIEVFNSAAHRIDAGGARHVAGDSHAVETAVPSTLAAGGYVVTWRVVSADSHPVNGAFTFFIGTASGGSAISSEASRLLARSAGSRTVGVAYGAVRFLAFVAVALVLGGLVFAAVIWPDAADDPRTRRILWSGLAALAVTTAAAFALEGVYGAGLGLGDVTRSGVLSAVWHTRFGKAYALRLVLLIPTGVLVFRLRLQRSRPRIHAFYLGAVAAIGVAILATWGLGDHASTGALVFLAVPFDVVHLGAASIWLGGLVMLVAVVLPAARATRGAAAGVLPRFSQWALGSVVAIVATGVFAGWRQVGVSWGALTTTPYGKLVIYKTGGLVVLVGIAALSRTTVHGGLALPGRGAAVAPTPPPAGSSAPEPATAPLTRLRNAVGAEIVVVLVVLALTAVLVGARPAKQAYAAPFSAEVRAGPTFVSVVVDPAKAGPLSVHMYILSSAGILEDVPEVDATMTDAAAGITGLTIPLHSAGPGHYVAYGFDVPVAGTWTIKVTVRTSAIDEYFSDPVTVHIR